MTGIKVTLGIIVTSLAGVLGVTGATASTQRAAVSHQVVLAAPAQSASAGSVAADSLSMSRPAQAPPAAEHAVTAGSVSARTATTVAAETAGLSMSRQARAPASVRKSSWYQYGFSWSGGPHFWIKASTNEVVGGIVFVLCARYAPPNLYRFCASADAAARRVTASWPGGAWIEVYPWGIRYGVWY